MEKRQLTPFGKITVIKTLALSKITHLFMSIPDPSNTFLRELDQMLFYFLWNEISYLEYTRYQDQTSLTFIC